MKTPGNMNEPAKGQRRFSPMSDEAFANLGSEQVAYIRPVALPVGNMVGIFSASGVELGIAPEAASALALIRDNDLLPVSLH